MRVIFMGTPDFAVSTLEALLASPHEVLAVFTQPDKPRGRSGRLLPTPVKEAAVREGIPVYQPKKIREEENVQILREYDPDVIVVAAFGQIIPPSILNLPKYGCVNVHASLLPKYRGAAPIQWAVINGETESGVTTMQMAEGLDTGDMLLKCVIPLEKDETGGSLFDKLSKAGGELLLDTLRGLEEGTIVPVPQPEKSPTEYARMLTKEMGRVDWNRTAVQIERLVRGLDPWPSAYTFLNGKQLKIWKAEIAGSASEGQGGTGDMAPGTVADVLKDRFLVQTGEGLLAVTEVQLEGKKRMDCASFLRGFDLERGMALQDEKQ